MSETIDHIGFISAIREGIAYVSLVQVSACATCSSKSACGVGESEKRYFEVPVHGDQWHVGDEVIVRVSAGTGFKALWWGYIMPFLLLLTILVTTIEAGLPEAQAGLLSLGTLLPYYLGLTLFRRGFAKSMSLKILKR
ncbi:MAG TPA: SoxR reducing system RseC family protein [Cyclobacteriaceae bacterium]|nr:SoxR reducing system RseC family protein [Cyclobacteriaceae bacterium]